MPVRLQMAGLTELRDALRQLPEDLARQADFIVSEHAVAAKNDIVRGYPVRTGTLASRVTVTQQRSRVSTQAIVRSRAPHAFIYEKGTRTRHTDKGASRGRMPAAPPSAAMIPKAQQYRRHMIEKLIELVRSAGFQVQG